MFGRTAHRRAERARIDEYTDLLAELGRTVTTENHHLAVQLAELPDTIRGYDTIKDGAAVQADEKRALLLREYRGQTG